MYKLFTLILVAALAGSVLLAAAVGKYNDKVVSL